MNSLDSLNRLIEAVEKAGKDIAPDYAEYVQLAFAIATDCGEAGRAAFHRLCALSSKYRRQEAERLYTSALRNNRGDVHLGTVFHLAERAGVKVEMPVDNAVNNYRNLQNPQNLHRDVSLTHTRANNKVETVRSPDFTGSEPLIPLPYFDDCHWPRLLAEARSHGKTQAQQDVLLLTSLVALGACMGKKVVCEYSGKRHFPGLQLFVVAPPASGKGVMSFVRKFLEPVHADVRCKVEAQMAAYRKEKLAYEALGKQRAETEAPQMPPNKMFIIPGNNSGTGVLQNLIDSDGIGVIFETEADTISTAIGSDYGHWSDTLRKTFDHDPLSYNRRTDREHREVDESFLAVILSGTPAQLQPLIPSAENGLFSRQLFYYMPSVKEWQDQFNRSERNTIDAFEQLAKVWKEQLDTLNRLGRVKVVLTDDQRQRFNALFKDLFDRSAVTAGDEMAGSVARLGIIILRLACVVAVLRLLESADPTGPDSLLQPDDGISADNLKDGIITRWKLAITDADLDAVFSLVVPLYRHALHALSLLPQVTVSRRIHVERTFFFAGLPATFTRREMLDLAESMKLKKKTVDSWLYRLMEKGEIEPGDAPGTYRKREAPE